MKILVFIAALLSASLAYAQSGDPSPAQLQKCLLGTFSDTWTQLNLTADQLERMRRVQQACREECEGAGARKVQDPVSNADGSTAMAEVKSILTVDQYRQWVAFCAKNAEGKPAK